jgi:hypothetical protein
MKIISHWLGKQLQFSALPTCTIKGVSFLQKALVQIKPKNSSTRSQEQAQSLLGSFSLANASAPGYSRCRANP